MSPWSVPVFVATQVVVVMISILAAVFFDVAMRENDRSPWRRVGLVCGSGLAVALAIIIGLQITVFF